VVVGLSLDQSHTGHSCVGSSQLRLSWTNLKRDVVQCTKCTTIYWCIFRFAKGPYTYDI